jgi:putative endonuclease
MPPPPDRPPRRPWWRRWFGTKAERAAAAFLRRRGHRVLGRNISDTLGELDLVTLDRGVIVFVEVRSTASDDPDRPAASVDAVKQRRVTEAALRFLHTRRLLGTPCRFDVVTVHWPGGAREPNIEHFPHAFEAVGQFQMWQ